MSSTADVFLDAALTVVDRCAQGLGIGGGFVLMVACFLGAGFCAGAFIVNRVHEVTCGRWSK